MRQLTTFGVAAIIALRLGVGWHFFKEGEAKFTGKSFTSVYFLQQSKGPLSDLYKSMIPDREGRERLNMEETVGFWQKYKDKVVKHYGFDGEQKQQADQLFNKAKDRLKWYFSDKGPDIEEYLLECDRLAEAKKGRDRKVAFRRDWIDSKEAELRSTAQPWLSDLQMMGEQFQADLQATATDVQQSQQGAYPIPDRSAMIVDTLVKWTVLLIGILLILGLFTRLASLAGIGFLLSVLSTQPPWVPGSETTYFYYQVVEVLALVVLLATSAGHFGGLDYIIRGLRLRCCPPKNIEI